MTRVAARDLQHIVKLRSFLGSTHKICVGSKTHASYQFHVASIQLFRRLCSLGRCEGLISPELVISRHFWRGLVDGDGSLGCYAKRPGGEPSAQFRLCGEGRALLAFTKFLREDGSTGARLTVCPHRASITSGQQD